MLINNYDELFTLFILSHISQDSWWDQMHVQKFVLFVLSSSLKRTNCSVFTNGVRTSLTVVIVFRPLRDDSDDHTPVLIWVKKMHNDLYMLCLWRSCRYFCVISKPLGSENKKKITKIPTYLLFYVLCVWQFMTTQKA